MADELVTGHAHELAGVTLIPSSGGIFEVRVDGEVVYSKDSTGRFPEKGEVIEAMKEKKLLE